MRRRESAVISVLSARDKRGSDRQGVKTGEDDSGRQREQRSDKEREIKRRRERNKRAEGGGGRSGGEGAL